MKIVIFGDSHCGPLSVARKSSPLSAQIEVHGSDGRNWAAPSVSVEDDGYWRFRAPALGEIRPLDLRLKPDDALYVFSSPLHTAPYVRSKVWETYCPWQVAELHPSQMPLPDAVIHSWVDTSLASRLAILDRMRAAGFNLVVVEAPRPLARTPDKLRRSADLMRAVDNICREHINALLRERGLQTIFVPEEAIEAGFTPDGYSSDNLDDPHHGNRRFGELMLSEILKFAHA